MHRKVAWVAIAPIIVMLFSSEAFSLDPGKRVSQYGHTAWRIQDGYFSGAPTAITQTRDGYIWIGTRSGLVRFDGTTFVPFRVTTGESLRSPRILSLLGDRDGSLWIGTGADLEHWQSNQLTHFPQTPGAAFGYVMQVFQARDASIWLARARVPDSLGPVCSVQGSSLRCFNQKDGVSASYLAGAIEAADGSFWLHTDRSLYHWDPNSRQALPGDVMQATGLDGLQHIVLEPGGAVLMAAVRSGSGVGITRARDGQIESYEVGRGAAARISIQQLFFDSRGSLWIGTDSDGVYRARGAQLDHFTTNDGLSNNTINGFFEDREGNIWVATNQGIDRFRDIIVTTYSAREGLSSDTVAAVLAASDGTLWINNFHSLDALHPDGSVTAFRAGKELPGQVVSSLMEDRKKRLWVGIDSGLQIFNGSGFRKLKMPKDQPEGNIDALTEDQQGNVWAISTDPNPHGSLLHFVDDRLEEVIPFEKLPIGKSVAIAADPREGVWLPLVNGDIAYKHHGETQTFALHRAPKTGFITGLVARADGFVISSSPLGLAVIRNNQIRMLSVEQGLPCAQIWTLIDTDTALWLYSECGAMQLRYSELERWWRDPEVHPEVSVLDTLDGVQAAGSGYFPRSSRSPDGRLWFANSSVVQMIDPRAQTDRVPLLPVLIEQLVADGKTYPVPREIELPPKTRNVQIDYSSPRFAVPQRVHFRYKLEGIDNDWVESGNRRQAFFTELNPGLYRFVVSAATGHSDWGTESTVTIRLLPMFYQTPWFRLLCAVLALLAVFLLFRFRMEVVKRELQSRLQVRMDERERIARDLHDTLFQNIQGILLKIDNSTNTLAEGHPVRSELQDALRLSDRVMAQSRDLVLALRAEDFDRRSISTALSQLGTDLSKLYTPPPAFRVVELGAAEILHPVVYDEVFQICREALLNAFRHSAARHIEVEILFTNDTFSVQITDDGAGIDERVLSEGRPGHFGLKGMMERAKRIGAKFMIRSRPGAGSELALSMPRSVARG